MTKQDWGFDTKDMDRKVRPQDDFYRYAGGGWISHTKMPSDETRWGAFSILVKKTQEQLHEIVKELVAKKGAKTGTPEQLVGDFFKSGMDEARRERLGIEPLLPLFGRVRKVRTHEELVDLLAQFDRIGISAPWGAFIDQDAKDSDRTLLHLMQSGLSLSDRDYYLKNDAESLRVRHALARHIPKLLALAGFDAKEAKHRADVVMRIETQLAKRQMDKVDCRDVEKTYHKMKIAQLAKIAPQVDWRRYLVRLGADPELDLVVMQPEYLKKAAWYFARVPVYEWQVYLEWQILNGFSGALSDAFVKQNFNFYGKALAGLKQIRPRWRRVLSTVDGGLGELIGKIYVERHFSPEAKRAMEELVGNLFEAYAARIRSLDWMSGTTKRKALAKLAQMHHKIGYPRKWRSYPGLRIDPRDYVGNILRTAEHEHRRAMRKLHRKTNRDEWFMYPQTVNAYYAPSLNDIVFPAAILQPPFFSALADAAVNYGAIGEVIGHEMTHGFDDQGAKFDGKGNLKTWWTREDKARFERKTKLLIKQFDAYTVADGVPVNGKFTLGENVADLGGAAIAYDAYTRHLEKHPEEDCEIDGFTPLQRFFLGFSIFEREIVRPEYQKLAAIHDPHSPGIYRINGPLSNMTEFYRAFDVKKGDKLWRAPKDRAKIW